MILHVVVLMVLALLPVAEPIKSKFDDLIVDSLDDGDAVEELDEPQEMDQQFEDLPMSTDLAVSDVSDMAPALEPSAEPVENLSQAVDVSPIGEVAVLSEGMMTNMGNSKTGPMSSRGSDASRKAAVAQGGGSAGSEAAVQAALAWLAAHQNDDGSWSFEHRGGKCKGRCDHPGTLKEARNAATGFGLLPFLGAGQTHKEGKYKDTVKKGLAFLAQRAVANGGGLNEGGGSLYSHGVCAIALSEAYAMTNDKNLFPAAQAALNFTCAAQDPQLGGWQYTPKNGSDTSGLGWQLMALKSGHMGYLSVPPQTIKNAVKFLDSVQADGGATYGYNTPGAGQATTAIGLLCRMYLGWKKDNPALQKGAQHLSNWGPSATKPNTANMYYNYYATQVMHHWEGEEWTKWNEKMRDFLVDTQAKDGHQKGSWYLVGDHGSELAGRVYCTSMAAITLEVYYRHLPLYRNNSTENEFEE